jgi:hypothetical protein
MKHKAKKHKKKKYVVQSEDDGRTLLEQNTHTSMADIKGIAFAPDSITITHQDDTTTVWTIGNVPPVAPTDTEVDILLSDGTTKKFVPAV